MTETQLVCPTCKGFKVIPDPNLDDMRAPDVSNTEILCPDCSSQKPVCRCARWWGAQCDACKEYYEANAPRQELRDVGIGLPLVSYHSPECTTPGCGGSGTLTLEETEPND